MYQSTSSTNALLQETTVTHDVLIDALSGYIETGPDGSVRHYDRDDRYHRTNGPAVIYPSGTRYWFQNGVLHRLDGPAVENVVRGVRIWYIYGKALSEKEFLQHVATVMNDEP